MGASDIKRYVCESAEIADLREELQNKEKRLQAGRSVLMSFKSFSSSF